MHTSKVMHATTSSPPRQGEWLQQQTIKKSSQFIFRPGKSFQREGLKRFLTLTAILEIIGQLHVYISKDFKII